MKQRRYIAYVLMAVCMIMLTASVFPHHHHLHVICLQQLTDACGCSSVETTPETHACACSGCHHHSGTDTCDNGCVTKFHCFSQQNSQPDMTPDFSFTTLLYSLADIFKFDFSEPLSERLDFLYIESLHSRTAHPTEALRAPPCV